MPARNRALSRRSVLKSTMVGAIGLATAANFPGLYSQAVLADDAALTLRRLAENIGFNIGTFVGGYNAETANLVGQDGIKKLFALQTGEFNLALEAMFWSPLQPNKGAFDFKNKDNSVNVSKNGNMKTFAHSLIWPAGNLPDWVKNGNYSRDGLIDAMNNQITTVMTRYKDKIDVWSIVNEMETTPDGKDIFYKTIGPDYIDIAYQTARQITPNAKLIYNDYDNHRSNGAKTQITRDVVNRLNSQGLVDGVGLHMGLDGAHPPAKDDVISTMKSYGVPVYVTEFSVNMRNVPGSQDIVDSTQADIYKSALESAIESGVCNDFIVFTLIDKLSYFETQSDIYGYSPNARPTPYDDNFQPKPAYYAMRDVLQNYQPNA